MNWKLLNPQASPCGKCNSFNSVNLWHITNGRTLEADTVVEEQVFTSFSWFQFVMLANFSLVSLLPLIWEKTKFPSLEKKLFIGEMFYPLGSFCCWRLLHSVFSHVSASLYPNLFDSEENAYGIIPQPVLSCVYWLQGEYLAQRSSFFVGWELVGPSFPHILAKKSQLARQQQIATSCLPRQQGMALSRGDSSPELLRRPFCRDIFPFFQKFVAECYRHSC